MRLPLQLLLTLTVAPHTEPHAAIPLLTASIGLAPDSAFICAPDSGSHSGDYDSDESGNGLPPSPACFLASFLAALGNVEPNGSIEAVASCNGTLYRLLATRTA